MAAQVSCRRKCPVQPVVRRFDKPDAFWGGHNQTLYSEQLGFKAGGNAVKTDRVEGRVSLPVGLKQARSKLHLLRSGADTSFNAVG